MIQITEQEHQKLLAKAERLAGVENELQRIQLEVIGAIMSAGGAMLEHNPCGPGEVASAINRLAAERWLLAKLAADEPQFFDPLMAMAAKNLRDRILRDVETKLA